MSVAVHAAVMRFALIFLVACATSQAAPAPSPVLGRVIDIRLTGGSTVITISGGSAQGIGKLWHATLLRGDTDKPLPDGKIDIVRVDKNMTIGKVGATNDEIRANLRVRFTP
ncbi:MAG TPA: hypothetical protein VGM88_04745 [Kofleriaceae bacterium]|jgi:hypothetical protein